MVFPAHWRSFMFMDEITKTKLRQVQLQILDRFVQICKENELRYFLCYGTCLGAVRHKGYIPWDDDIDVCMPRKDFMVFVEIVLSQKDTDYFFEYYMTNPTYGHCFAKYCKRNTLFIEPNGLKQAIYIDIFIQDKIPSPEYALKSRVPLLIHKIDALTTVRREGLVGRDFLTRCVYYLTRWVPVKWFFKLETRLMVRFEETDAKYYLDYGDTPFHMDRITIPIDEFEPYTQLEFEGKMYNVPRNWHLYLSRIYGDYMTLPPIEKRVTHYPQLICFNTDTDDIIIP